MFDKIKDLYMSVTTWMPVLVGLVLVAEAESENKGSGSEKKAEVLAKLEENLKDDYPWISESWVKNCMGHLINILVSVLNKYGKGLMQQLAAFVPKA